MALGIPNFTGTTVAPGGDYPFGDVKDQPGGTLVDRKFTDDGLQFFQKLMNLAGITPSGNPDNVSNGYQIQQAFDILTGRDAWAALVPGIIAGGGGGTIDVSGAKTVYSRYRIIGKTLFVQQQFRGAVVTGTMSDIIIVMPNFPANDDGIVTGCSIDNGGGRVLVFSELHHGLVGTLELMHSFGAGTYDIDVNVCYEIV